MTKGSVANPPATGGRNTNVAQVVPLLQVRFLWTGRIVLAAALGFGLFGCQPESVRQEKALRRQLVHELRNHSYASAAPIARQLLQRKPADERLWKQLVHAQIGLQDFDGAKQSLQRWRTAVPKPSVRASEFEGDIARDERDYSTAFAAWDKVIQGQPNNRRVVEKSAVLHQSLQHWADAEKAWDAAIRLKETTSARLNRAVCRRRLHRWNEAFDDFEHAQRLGADDPEVRRWSKVFDGLQKYKQQIGELDAKVELLPEEVGLLSERALVFLRAEDFEMALEDGEHAAKLGPWALRPKLFQGIALVQLGKIRQLDALSLRRPLSLGSLSPEFLETASRLDLAIAVERTNPDH